MSLTRETSNAEQAFLRIVCFNVGQGSCVLLSFPPREAGGPRRYAVVDCNDSQAYEVDEFIQKPPPEAVDEGPGYPEHCELEFVALTHYDRDHFNGIYKLVGADGSRFRARRFLGPISPPKQVAQDKYEPSSWEYQQLFRLNEFTWARNRTKRGRAAEDPLLALFRCGHVYEWGKEIDALLRITALAPTDTGATGEAANREEGSRGQTNLQSGALRVQYGRTAALIGGDVESEEWRRIIEARNGLQSLLPANAVIVPHHGGEGNPPELWACASRLSSSALGRAGSPPSNGVERRRARTIAMVSCAADGNSSVPSVETLRTLADARTTVYCTNTSMTCRRHHITLGRQPRCAPLGKPRSRIKPTDIPGISYSGDRQQYDLLQQLAPSDVFEGTIIVDLFAASAPRVIHIGRPQSQSECIDAFLAAASG